ncbi:SMP-30/gluconolactonase/LRE family protein [Phytoactinopolyspora halophila]|uniref:SMP-30/gluconolactonase/LRE family protein n=1 Tax=Phytoactinopolyspora halophila TaxID=1981511 RepID=UPI001314BD82|nr:SMP-30/gluconolactonase/LRE family protein [Phytoactinopolyspora halophila]
MRATLIDEPDGPRTVLGESPRWDGRIWWWVDASDGVWARQPGRSATAVWSLGERTSLVHPEVSGGAVVARQQVLYVLRRRGPGMRFTAVRWCDLGLDEGWMVNDGVADSWGRLWIGSIAPGQAPGGGALLRVEPDGRIAAAVEGFTMSNGMAWDVAEKHLLHVDTLERTVWSHRVDMASGTVLGSERFLTFSPDDAVPDGLATDIDGGVWVAMYGAGEIRRYDASGVFDTSVEVDPPQSTSVELGGPDRKELLITTAREGYNDERSAREPWAGRLYHARSEHAGVARRPAVVEMGLI